MFSCFLSHVYLPLTVFLNCWMRWSHLNPLYCKWHHMHSLGYCIVHHIYIGKHLLFCPVENLIEMVALSMSNLCVRISNVNPYHGNNIFYTESVICFCRYDRYELHIYMFEGTLLNLIIEANSAVPDRTDP